MAGFPIFDLNPVFMEKVINKLKEKSYFRIQQTCRGMGEFIRNSSNISVLIGGIYYPFWDDERQCYAFNSTSYSGRYPVEALYGTKIRSIEPDTDGDKVDSLCEMLKENRITCIQLVIYELEWTIDQCVKLLNTVKAAEVDLNSADSNRYEAVFQVKGLKEVELRVKDEYDVASMAPRLLPVFRKVAFRVEDCQEEKPYELLRTFLKNLFSFKYLPHLHEFYCTTWWTDVPTIAELEKELNGYTWTITETEEDDEMIFSVHLPDHFPTGKSVTVSIQAGHYIDITYVGGGSEDGDDSEDEYGTWKDSEDNPED